MTTATSGQHTLLVDAEQVGLRVRQALIRVVQSVPNAGGSPSLPHLKGINATLRSRLSRALRTEAPLDSLLHMPGPEALRSALAAAERAGASADALEGGKAAVAALERFLSAEAMDRETLRSCLGGVTPEAREKHLRSNAHLSHKASSNLSGYSCDVFSGLHILTPGSRPDRCDAVVIFGCVGWRWLRPDAWSCFFGSGFAQEDPAGVPPRLTLDGRPLAELTSPPMLRDFCSGAPPLFEPVAYAGARVYQLRGTQLGARSECTFFMAELAPNSELRHATEAETALLMTACPVPAKRLIFDVLLHADVCPGTDPEVECYRLGPLGVVEEKRRAGRQLDRIDLGASWRALGVGLASLDTTEVPRYRDLVEHALATRGYSPAAFRGYRCELSYPLDWAQVSMRFPLPGRPE